MRLRLPFLILFAAASVTWTHAQTTTPAVPQTQPASAAAPTQPGSDRLIITEHELRLVGGKSLKYRATAGTLAMKDDAGKHKADLFSVAYEKLPLASDPATRPVTFVFNGGPGAASVWLHVGTAGPQRIDLTEAGEVPPPPNRLVDNEFTWLADTDLVFIDPVNTGYSRPAPGEDPKQFYGVENDVKWVGHFIRLWTTRNARWGSPKFLAGESYGTTRAAALSGYLQESTAISLNGIILVSAVLDFSTLWPSEGRDVPYVVYLPTYTAVAGHHKKLPPDFQRDVPAAIREAEKWARTEYVAALAQGDSLPAEKRQSIAKSLASFTGIPADIIDKANLRIGPSLFRALLLENDRKTVGRFDGRLTGYDSTPLDRDPEFDPSLSAFLGAYGGSFNAYVRRELKFESDLTYEVLNDVGPWDFSVPGGGHLYVADRLRAAMAGTPGLKVFVAGGYHDLATPYLATRYTLDHMKLSPELRANVTEIIYNGGHMMYHRRETLKKLNGDVATFIRSATTRDAAVAE